MSRQPARQTFGLKNTKTSPPPPEKAKASGGGGIDIHPLILAGGMAFVIAVAMVLMLGGQPQAVPGQVPQVTEVSNGTQPIKPAAPAQQPQQPAPPPASGGKFGAATEALGKQNR
jgi:hypothetical protein